MRSRAQDPDPAAGVLDNRPHIPAGAAQGDSLNEVAGKQRADRERRKLAQVAEVHSGAGSIPACCRISHTVEVAILMPRTSSSP
jgi:hypothetical protein